MEIKFKRDTSFRKQFFTPESFAHPAKMDAQLLLWIVERYTQPGEVILDPMAGMGTTMLACTLGRNVVLVELEEKFCKMCKSNWEKVSAMPQLGYEMGQCNIVQGDARQLEGLVDKIVTSPPYAEAIGRDAKYYEKIDTANKKRALEMYGKQLPSYTANLKYSYVKDNMGDTEGNIGNLPYGQIDKIVTSPPYEEAMGKKHHSPRADKLAKEKSNPTTYTGQIDKIVTSPPYEGSDVSQTHMTSDKRGDPNDPNYRPSWKRKLVEGYAKTKRPYHEMDSIITSPPYEEVRPKSSAEPQEAYRPELKGLIKSSKQTDTNNIGNLKSESYLEAMLQVYQQCHKVLKPEGLMILVTKNFIRNKQVVRLDEDTIKLCEQAGFGFLERHYRKLTSQSFWRTIYHQKHPEVERIEHEDVLVFI